MIRTALSAGVVLLGAMACAWGAPAGDAPAALELWDDPTFQKQFLGSYGVNAELEPRLSQVEREELEKLLPTLASDPEVAVGELELLATPESSAVFDFTLANVHFQAGRLEDAAARYERAVEKFPSFRRAHKNLGLIRVRQARFDEAIRSLSRVVELGGGDGLTMGLLGYSYASTEQYVSAESAYRGAVLLQPTVQDWKLGLTQAVFKQRKYPESAALCQELIDLHPDRSDYWLLQANAYIGMSQPMRAAENYEIVDRMGKATPQVLHTLGDIYVNEGLWDLAARAYGRSLEADPEQPVDRAVRSVEVLAQRGALEQAAALLDRVDSAYRGRIDDAQRGRLLKLRARIAVADGEQGAEAVDALEEIVSIDPLDGEALMLLGQHYARVDEPDRALFYFERAASLEPFEADAKVRQAQVLVSRSRYGDAVPLLRRAQELNPREDVARYLEQVERVARAQN